MVDRLLLLAAVNMVEAPTTNGVAKRLAVSDEEAESALHDAERARLVAKQEREIAAAPVPRARRPRWRLSDAGRAEMYRLLHAG